MPTESTRLANELAASRGYISTPPLIPGNIASIINAQMTDQARMPFEVNLPQYGANTAQRATNTGSLLRGEVPLDVRNQIMQAGAERGIATGSPGSSNANAAWLRALGLASLGLKQQGSQQFSQEIADTPVPELFNPASLFVPQTLAADEARYAQQGQAAGAATARAAASAARAPAQSAWNSRPDSVTSTIYTGGSYYGRAGW